MIDIADFSYLAHRNTEVFGSDGLTDDELLSLVEQTGIETVAIELEFIADFRGDRWHASYTTVNDQMRFGYLESSPLRAMCAVVILGHLAEVDWQNLYGEPL